MADFRVIGAHDSSYKIAASDLQLRYPGFTLDIEGFGIKTGEQLALLGPSGSGKSTLLMCMAGLEPADSGSVLLDGEPLTRSSAQRSIATVFQTPYLFKGTVGYNVSYGLRMRKRPATEIKARVAEVLQLVGLSNWEKRSILGLSGGEAQRVALARGLVLQPDIMMLDEPLSSLDEALRKTLSVEFSEILRDQKVTVLYVTHSKQEAFTVADSIAIMKDGQLLIHERSKNLFAEIDSVNAPHQQDWLRSFLAPDDWWLHMEEKR
ncbi:MAG: ABC transporter ATP-binding protein [Coriobacteriia bacterium]|nr:ABC transporter ATP-binding protein [Coriobacteriia bacterium]MCL2537568.1 ABC transporter ATP-binding protein [Coriobacteriia bacterium]